jgi:hypothetical protein
MPIVPKVVVAWHDFGQVTGEFTFSLANMVAYSGHVFFGAIRQQSCYLTTARNQIVDKFLKSPADYLLMVDADLEFNADALNRTLSIQQMTDAPILYGNYCLGDGRSSIFLRVDEYGLPVHGDVLEPKTIYNVAVGATGWMLATREALEAFKAPFSHDPWPWFGHDLAKAPNYTALKNTEDELRLGEDVSFCKRARALGIPMFGYTGLMLLHHKSSPILNDFMIPYAQELGLPLGEVYGGSPK